ncbi:molecular chaperone DnaJ [bacterium]|nr:molecular chaperone DnaJ [bacterium]
MAKRDYYEVLMVTREAGDEELKKAYRRLAIQCHPDRNPGNAEAEAQFKEVNEAYQVLSDAKKRAAYDQFGHAGLGGAGFGGDAGFNSSFSDIFDNIFGDIFGQSQNAWGVDLRYNMEIEFEEAVHGTEKTITFEKEASCEKCQGSGAKPGSTPKKCKTCKGSGQMHFNQGFFTLSRTCSTCAGRGAVIEQACSECVGRGRVKKPTSVQVKIPAGIDSDQRLRLRGEGESQQGSRPGDLYVHVRVKEHALFQREGEHLLLDLPISFVHAALGAKIEIPSLEGPAQIAVPAGTQSGELLRLRGKGIRRLNGHGTGDLVVRVLVETPSKLSQKQKDLLRQFSEEESRGTHPAVDSFLEKFRGLFK